MIDGMSGVYDYYKSECIRQDDEPIDEKMFFMCMSRWLMYTVERYLMEHKDMHPEAGLVTRVELDDCDHEVIIAPCKNPHGHKYFIFTKSSDADDFMEELNEKYKVPRESAIDMDREITL